MGGGFRRHLEDPRAREVVNLAAQRLGWAGFQRQAGRGRGFGFARYKILAAYVAAAFEVEVERETGRVRAVRAMAAVDSGDAVNPDGHPQSDRGQHRPVVELDAL